MSAYQIIANGHIDKVLTGNPTGTFWRSVHKQCTKFACESVSQPFGTPALFGQEAQITLSRVGDLIYYLYVHVTLPGIVAEENQGAMGGQFPCEHTPCNPCGHMDEAALLEYLPANYSQLQPEDKVDALKDAKNKWRKQALGAAPELDCCVDGDADCPDTVCPELGDCWAYYCNDVGHWLISKAKLLVGGQEIDRLWSIFLFCWEELSGKSGRRLQELTGRRFTRSQLICDSRMERELYIPLPFFFSLASGSALPLVSLAYHGVQLNIEFEKIEKLIVVSQPDVIVKHARTGLPITPADLKAQMEITYVYLDTTERAQFSGATFDQLIVQTQHYFKTESKQACRVALHFNHPVIELIFCVRRTCQEMANNWGNFSGMDGLDPVKSADLLLNTASRWGGKKPAVYWRSVVPYQHHSNIPEAFIYCMSFALNPESTEPSGSCNFSRIDNIELDLEMASNFANESYNVYLMARSWNIMSYKEGVGGPAFQ